MASWKQLTDTSNLHVAVNMEQVCFMRQRPNYAELHFGTLVLPKGRFDTMRHRGTLTGQPPRA
jgi:hypothetical protein